ncbi:MAG TPA: DUF3455 domain-containing protein [Steroidobacteraceae bacterium]|nr:DUF3455 domain-containing protein [Steroidobacteraceae bacterium]
MIPLTALLGLSIAQSASRPDVPDAIKAPAGEQVVLVAHAAGSQIYTCGKGDDGKPQWTLKAPEAQLRDTTGALIGHHSAGPSWKHIDGSAVTGKAVAKAASPDASSIPWLLLTVVSHSGKGALERVTSIQRVHTRGGQPPPGGKCDPSKPNAETWIPYTADYYFFAPAAAAK